VKQYGFLIVERTNRWQVSFPDREDTEEFQAKADAEIASSEWSRKEEAKRDRKLEAAARESATKREVFRADTKFELVTVRNSNPFQADFHKPTVIFPDGSETRFEEGTLKELIEDHIKERSLKAFPDPKPTDPRFRVEAPTVDEIRVWEAELVLGDERRSLPDIKSWSHYFPAESVAIALNDLAVDGWSVAHVSEDRGLYTSDIAMNRSAPVLARYLLVRERAA
jgi:hypothetical protein